MKLSIMILAFLSLFLAGCIQDVKSWEKGKLAKETMKKEAGNDLRAAFKEHVYFSKEATKGGTGVSGGGCGCN